jgi:hypothetical protein
MRWPAPDPDRRGHRVEPRVDAGHGIRECVCYPHRVVAYCDTVGACDASSGDRGDWDLREEPTREWVEAEDAVISAAGNPYRAAADGETVGGV